MYTSDEPHYRARVRPGPLKCRLIRYFKHRRNFSWCKLNLYTFSFLFQKKKNIQPSLEFSTTAQNLLNYWPIIWEMRCTICGLSYHRSVNYYYLLSSASICLSQKYNIFPRIFIIYLPSLHEEIHFA